MKTFFTLLIGVFTFTSFQAQNYSRVKVFGDNEDLYRLGELGIAVDHGIHKEGMFFISDFSKQEIEIMNQYGFDHEILIADVEAYYVELLNNPSKDPNQILKNA